MTVLAGGSPARPLGGGADLIRQDLAAGVVDELAISTAPPRRMFAVGVEDRAAHWSRNAGHTVDPGQQVEPARTTAKS